LVDLRILHLSNAGLPDLRIEKMANTMKKEGHELLFLGGRPIRGQNLGAFDLTYSLLLPSSFRVVYDPRVENQWVKRISELKPDIVHAHNCTIAKFMLKTDFPTIFDDHEYYSKQSSRYDVWPFFKKQLVKPMIKRFPIWERQLLERYPTLTSNKNIAKEHRKFGSFVEPVPNVPTRNQVADLPDTDERGGYVYVGNDFKLKRFLPHRDMTGLTDILQFDVITGLTHREMMERLMHYEVGLTPWHKHQWHPYSEANKNYEYMHAGMPVLTNTIIKKQNFPDDPFVYSFDSYDEILDVLNDIPEHDRTKIQEHALNEYVWELSEPVIREAYKRA